MLARRTSVLCLFVVALLVLAAASRSEFDVSEPQHSDAHPTTTPLHVTDAPPTTCCNDSKPTTMIPPHHGGLLKATRAIAPPSDISLHPLNKSSAKGFRIFGYILAGLFVGTILGLIIRVYFRQWVEVFCLALQEAYWRRVEVERRRWYGR